MKSDIFKMYFFKKTVMSSWDSFSVHVVEAENLLVFRSRLDYGEPNTRRHISKLDTIYLVAWHYPIIKREQDTTNLDILLHPMDITTYPMGQCGMSSWATLHNPSHITCSWVALCYSAGYLV